MKYVTAVNKLRKLADRFEEPAAWPADATLIRLGLQPAERYPTLDALVRADVFDGPVFCWKADYGSAWLAALSPGSTAAGEGWSVKTALSIAAGQSDHREARFGRLKLTVEVATDPAASRWQATVQAYSRRPGFTAGQAELPIQTTLTDRDGLALARGFLAGSDPFGLLDFLADRDEAWEGPIRAMSLPDDVTSPDELWREVESVQRQARANHQAYGYRLDSSLVTHGLVVVADADGNVLIQEYGHSRVFARLPVTGRAACDALWAELLAARAALVADREKTLALREAACVRADRLVAAVRAELPDVKVEGPDREDPPPPLRPVAHCDVLIDGHTVRVFGDPAEHTVVDPGPDPGPADPSRRMWMGTDEETVAVLVERCYPAKAGEVYFPKPATSPRSWACFYQTAGGGDWATNSVRFADREAARAAGAAKFMNWTACKAWRVEPSDDEPTEPARAAA